MSDLKWQIEQRLTANILMDKCASDSYLIFREAWCTQDRILRFATPFFRTLFSTQEGHSGYWKTGDAAMYEVEISGDSLSVTCFLNSKELHGNHAQAILGINTCVPGQKSLYSLNRWVCPSNGDSTAYLAWFDNFLSKELHQFEKGITQYLLNFEDEPCHEGNAVAFSGQKYERNPKARAACLAHYGSVCALCGMDFGHTYGPEFSDIIEVHHIVPLCQIGRAYTVNPIRDLIPVCPNCHAALHHKKNGVYTIEELKHLLRHTEK